MVGAAAEYLMEGCVTVVTQVGALCLQAARCIPPSGSTSLWSNPAATYSHNLLYKKNRLKFHNVELTGFCVVTRFDAIPQ